MLELSKGNIRQITETIDRADITFSHLRDDLIDHICCEVEEKMQKGLDFQKAFAGIKKSFGIKDLQKVQEQTLLLIDKKYCAMKKTMKVSGIISISLLMFASLFKINHWPLASIMLVLGFFVLCFFFLPSANFVMHKENKDRSLILLYISAFLGSFGFFVGILFKVMHWPGANLFLLVGILILALLFLPILLKYLLKKAKEKREKTVYVIGIVSGIIYLTGFLFKMMHWPAAVILLTVGSTILVVVFLTSYTLLKYKKEKNVKASFIYIIAAIAWFLLFSALISLSVSGSIINAYIVDYGAIEKNKAMIESQNNTLLDKSRQNNCYEMAIEIEKKSTDLINFVEAIKVDIVKAIGEDNKQAIEGGIVNIKKIKNFDNNYYTHFILIGEDHKGKAFELKERIEDLREQLINLSGKDGNTTKVINTLLDTSLPENRPEWAKSWEMMYFNHISVVGCMNVLSTLQRNVRLAEKEALHSLMRINSISKQ